MTSTVRGLLALGSLLAILVLSPTHAQEQPGSPHTDPNAKFVGSKACRKCHLKEFRSWEETKMAKAFSILAPGERKAIKEQAKLDPTVDYRTNAECVECHTVGAGHEGGFAQGYDIAADPKRLLDVGCEMCHGPGGNFVGPGMKDRDYQANHDARLPELLKVGYVPEPGEQACTRCHNERSPTWALNGSAFDYEKRKAEGLHAVPEGH